MHGWTTARQQLPEQTSWSVTGIPRPPLLFVFPPLWKWESCKRQNLQLQAARSTIKICCFCFCNYKRWLQVAFSYQSVSHTSWKLGFARQTSKIQSEAERKANNSRNQNTESEVLLFVGLPFLTSGIQRLSNYSNFNFKESSSNNSIRSVLTDKHGKSS